MHYQILYFICYLFSYLLQLYIFNKTPNINNSNICKAVWETKKHSYKQNVNQLTPKKIKEQIMAFAFAGSAVR